MRSEAEIAQAIAAFTRRRNELPTLDPAQSALAHYVMALRWATDQERVTRGMSLAQYLDDIQAQWEAEERDKRLGFPPLTGTK